MRSKLSSSATASNLPPATPNYNIKHLRELSGKVQKLVLSFGITNALTDKGRAVLHARIRKLLKMKEPEYQVREEQDRALMSIIDLYTQQEVDAAAARRIGVTVAGWEKEIMQGIPFEPCSSFRDSSSWAVLYIADVRRLVKHGRHYKCLLESYAGPSSSMVWHRPFTGKGLQYLIREIGGVRFALDEFGYRQPAEYLAEDIGGLWFTAWVGFRQGNFSLDNIFASHSQKKQNRILLDMRRGPCIKKIHKKCLNCHLGRSGCKLARHREEYVEGICRNTRSETHKGYLTDTGYCLYCMRTARFTVPPPEQKQKEKSHGHER